MDRSTRRSLGETNEGTSVQQSRGDVLNIMGCRSVQYGSFEDYLVRLAEECRGRRMTAVFVYPEDPADPRFKAEVERAGGRFVVVPGTETPTRAGAIALWRMILHDKPLVVHAHFGRMGYLGALLGRLAGVPVVLLSKHQTSWPFVTRKTRLTYTALSRLVTAVLVGATPVLDELPSLGVPARKRRFVPFPGVDTERYRPMPESRDVMRARLGVEPDETMLIAVSHLKEQKGVRYLVAAMDEVAHRYASARLFIVGDGQTRKQLESRATEMGLQDRISFLGHRADVPELLAAADLFVCPSLCEGGCAGSLEAMAVGKPIVTTPVGIARDLVAMSDSGVVVESKNPESLARGIAALFDRRAELAAMGARARTSVEEYANVQLVAASLADAYASSLSSRQGLPAGATVPWPQTSLNRQAAE